MNLCQGLGFRSPDAEDVSRVHGKKVFALSITQDESVLRAAGLTR